MKLLSGLKAKERLEILVKVVNRKFEKFDQKFQEDFLRNIYLPVMERFKHQISKLGEIQVDFNYFLLFRLDKANTIQEVASVTKYLIKNDDLFVNILHNSVSKKSLDLLIIFLISYFNYSKLKISFGKLKVMIKILIYQDYTYTQESLFKLESVIGKYMKVHQNDIHNLLELFKEDNLKEKRQIKLLILKVIYQLSVKTQKNLESFEQNSKQLLDQGEEIFALVKEDQLSVSLLLELLTNFLIPKILFDQLKNEYFFKLEKFKSNLLEKAQETEKELEEVIILIILIWEYRISQKLGYNPKLWSLVDKLFEIESKKIEFLVILVILIENHTYLKKLVKSEKTFAFLKKKDLNNFRNFSLILEFLFRILSNTHEEKLKELKINYDINDNSLKGFEKLNKMMKNSKIEFIKEQDLQDHKFHEKIISELKFYFQVKNFCKKNLDLIFPKFDKIIFIVYKILLCNKFNAAKFLDRYFLLALNKFKTVVFEMENSSKQLFFNFLSRFVAGIEVQSFQEHEQPFLVDNLCQCIHESNTNLAIFEALLSLTRFSGEKFEYNYRIWKENRLENVMYDFFFHDNQMIKIAAIELLNNLILDKRIFSEFILNKQTTSFLIHLREIIRIFLKRKYHRFTKEDLKFGKDGYIFSIAVSLSVLICYAQPRSVREFKKFVNFTELRVFIETAYDDQNFKKDLIDKIKMIA